MKFGEVVSNEHMDQPVPVEDKVLETVYATESDDAVIHGYNREWEDDELDLIVFRCRD